VRELPVAARLRNLLAAVRAAPLYFYCLPEATTVCFGPCPPKAFKKVFPPLTIKSAKNNVHFFSSSIAIIFDQNLRKKFSDFFALGGVCS
jgi:hypothetical protein